MPKLSSVAGLAGQIVTADRSAVMADLAAGLFGELNRRAIEQLVSLCRPINEEDDIVHHIVRSAPCRN
jgi:hypothetical protein